MTPMYRITRSLSIGRFVTPERAEWLLESGVTHVLNVSDAPSRVMSGEGLFRAVEWVPITDLSRIPNPLATQAIDALHRMASESDSQVYVHCIAGQLRSPTILWLYLIACGFTPVDARDVIEQRSLEAQPGHPRLVDDALIRHVQKHGRKHYSPHPRAEAIVPFEDG
jgi:hypothetical protein